MSPHPPSLTWQYVDRGAAAHPSAEALVCGDVRLDWRGFADRVDRTAQALLDLGVQRGDRVAMVAMGRLEFPIVFMAANKVGAIWLGLTPKYTRAELARILADCRPAVLVTERESLGRDLAEDVQALVGEFPDLRGVLVLGEPFRGAMGFDDWVDRPRPDGHAALAQRISECRPDDPALLMYTSGSTGRPKGVIHTHAGIVANIAVEYDRFDLGRHSSFLMCFPINHVAAAVEIGFASIYAGTTLVITDRFDPDQALELIEREGVSLMGGVPAMFLMQMASPRWASTDFSRVKAFVWAGSAAPRGMVEALAGIAARTGARLITGYGSTEVAGFVTYTSPDDDLDTLADTAGKVADPLQLRVVDAARRPLPAGATGEIALRGPVVMRGYWNDEKATADAVDQDGWYYTGDLAWLDERGYIHIVGRTSEMYKSGGENIHPREIEDVVATHPDVLAVAVVGVPDPLYQEVGHAFVVLRPGAAADDSELRAFCRARLASFKVPKRFVIRRDLPVLPTGKVDRAALREEARSAQDPQ